MKLLRQIFLLLLLSALSGAVWVAHRPAHWSALDTTAPPRPPPLGVFEQMDQARIKRSAPFEISEARLNQHLQQQLQPLVSEPFLARWLRAEAPAIALKNDLAELRLRWTLGGHHLTDLTVQLRVLREADSFRIDILSGAYGRLRVPRGLLHPVKPLLAQLSAALQPEIDVLFQMNHIRIAEHKLLLDPRFTDLAVSP